MNLMGVMPAKGGLVEPLQARIHLCDGKGEINDPWDSLPTSATGKKNR
jgi:hypothetical protein